MKTILKYIKFLRYRLLWHIAPLLPHGKLIHLDLEVNNSCNSACIMCWHSKKKLPFEKGVMTLDRAYNYLKQGRELGALSCKLNWRGEPLLYKYSLPLLIQRAKQLGYVEVCINTNGVLLNYNYMKDLASAGLDKCIVSVDSFDKTTYNKIHGITDGRKRDFNRLMENLETIADMIINGEIKTKVLLNFHMNKYNQYENFRETGGHLYYFYQPVFRYTEDREGKDISLKRNRKRKKKCLHMYRRLTVSANDKIFPCCVAYLEPKDLTLADGLLRGYDLKTAEVKRRALIDNYKAGKLTKSCINCKSGDNYE